MKATRWFIERAHLYAIATTVTVTCPEFNTCLGIYGPLHNTRISGYIYLEGETNHNNILVGTSGGGTTTTTDETGRFGTLGPPNGTWTIYASKDGYITKTIENVVFDNSAYANITMTLEKE